MVVDSSISSTPASRPAPTASIQSCLPTARNRASSAPLPPRPPSSNCVAARRTSRTSFAHLEMLAPQRGGGRYNVVICLTRPFGLLRPSALTRRMAMSSDSSRRQFLRTTALAGIAGLGDLGFLGTLPPVSAADAKLDPKVVRLDPE